MRKQTPLRIILALGLLGLGIGCGGDAGQPGSSGFEDTGTEVTIQIVPDETHNVDCFRTLDCDADPETDDPEPFSDHLATAFITGTTYYNPTDPNFDPEAPEETISASTIFLERYTIEYVPENPAAPPLRMREIYETIVIPAPEDLDTPTEVIFDGIVLADLQTKREFGEIIQAGSIIGDPSAFPVRYTAVYNFYGQSEFGYNVKYRVTAHATFGNFDNCE